MGWLPPKTSSQQVWFCMSIFTLHLASFYFLLQESSCQSQSHLTSKYSVTDVNEDCIIFCVTQRVFLWLFKSQTLVQFWLGSAILVKGNGTALSAFLKHWSFSDLILNFLNPGFMNKCLFLDSRFISSLRLNVTFILKKLYTTKYIFFFSYGVVSFIAKGFTAQKC